LWRTHPTPLRQRPPRRSGAQPGDARSGRASRQEGEGSASGVPWGDGLRQGDLGLLGWGRVFMV